MVKVNGKEFTEYSLDTEQTFIERLAASLETLPKYLYFEEPLDVKKIPEKITVRDFLDAFKNAQSDDLPKLYDEITATIDTLSTEDIISSFLSFNIALEKVADQFRDQPDDFYNYIFALTGDVFEEEYGHYINYAWDNREYFKEKTNQEIKQNINTVEKKKQAFREFDKISLDDSVRYLPFEQQSSVFIMKLDISIDSIPEIFNLIELSPSVPFASYNNFYKILKDFTPPDNTWSVSLEDYLVFRIVQKIDIFTATQSKDYAQASMMIDNGEVIVEVELFSSGVNITREQFISRFEGIFKGAAKVTGEIEEKSIKGVTYFPRLALDKYIIADIVMNNFVLASIFTIDENQDPTNQKKSVFLILDNKSIGKMSVRLSTKEVIKGDIILRNKDVVRDFPVGSNFVRAKISTENMATVKIVEAFLYKLISFYQKEKLHIEKIYKQYIPDFELLCEKEEDKKPPKLNALAPEVFVVGYSPTCPYKPTVIEDSEVEEAKRAGKIVMKYPNEPKEGLPIRNYTCNHTRAIYPGLRENPLSNKDLTLYLPCCYEKNHETKSGSVFRHYYYGESRKEHKFGQQEMIKTSKFVDFNTFGVLPDDISNIFESFAPEGLIYVRKGVLDTKNSFIQCVMEAMGDEIIGFATNAEREARLRSVRKSMATLPYAALCKQQMYDFTLLEIKDIIANNDAYFVPLYFTTLLEEYFNCNIYIFQREKKTGRLILPRYTQALYKNKKVARSVFIYEHMGAQSDHAPHGRCELIVGYRIGKIAKYHSAYESKVSMGIRSIYNKLRLTYALNIELEEIIFPIKEIEGLQLIEQGLDSYGKCRLIKFIYNTKKYSIFTTPIPPFAVLLVNSWKPDYLPTQTEVVELFTSLGITLTGQNSYRNEIYEVYGVFGNVKITCPIIKTTSSLPHLPIYNNGLTFQKNSVSELASFNFYKKLARYITEYTFWLFSRYLVECEKKNEPKSMHDLATVNDFQDKNIVIIKGFKYQSVKKEFSMTSSVMQDGKLVLKSKKTLQNLMAVLRLSIRRFADKIKNYHKRTVIEHYYLDITDFTPSKTQIVLCGEDSVDKWINEQKIKHYIYDTIQINIPTPYLFKNNLISNIPYLAQNTDSIEKALGIAKTWYAKGYNPGDNPPEKVSDVAYTLYAYVSRTDIKRYKVLGNVTKNSIVILGYKINDIPMFTVLLSL